MTAFQILIKSSSLQTLWLGFAAVVAGSAAAAAHGNFEPVPALACLLFAAFAQCCSNVTHRYADARHGYGENEEDNITHAEDVNRPVSYILKEGISVFSILSATAGLAVMSMAGWWTLIIAVLLAIVVLVSTAGPRPLCRTVFYPVITFLIFGPIAVIGTALVQSQRSAANILSWWDLSPALMMSIVIGLMAANCHILYGLFHRQRNALQSRTTFYGRYGWKATGVLLSANTVMYGVTGLVSPLIMELSEWYLYSPVPLLSMAFSFLIIYFARKQGCGRLAWKLSLVNIVGFAVLSLIVFCIIGYPHGYLDNSASIF